MEDLITRAIPIVATLGLGLCTSAGCNLDVSIIGNAGDTAGAETTGGWDPWVTGGTGGAETTGGWDPWNTTGNSDSNGCPEGTWGDTEDAWYPGACGPSPTTGGWDPGVTTGD